MAFRNLLNCFICDGRFQARLMRRIDNNDDVAKRDISIFRRDAAGRPPLEVTDLTRICVHCNTSILNEIAEVERDPTCMRLNVLTQTRSESCLICNADRDIQRLSLEARVNVFIISNIYIPSNVRSCQIHLDERGFLLTALHPGLRFVNKPYIIKGQELQSILQELRRNVLNSSQVINENSFTDEEFKAMTSLTKQEFEDLFSFCDPIPADGFYRYTEKKDLITFLTKMRHGLSDEFLKVIFKYSSRQAVSLLISKVRQSLMLRFVPQNIGFNSITRHDYIGQHVTEFANILYNSEPNTRKAIVYTDGTYAYIEKSSNFRVLRQSYCLHKGHLVKPVLFVAPDGYILDIQGPYFSDFLNNDAALLRAEFERDINHMNEWFNDNDILIIDRGYRDATDLLQRLNIRYHMPELLGRGQRQFTTEQANASRLVTKTRWVIESRNGHIKSIFKFLSQTIRTPHVSNIGDFYRIAGAIINRYHGPVQMENANAEMAQRLLARSQLVNVVQARVEQENLRRRRNAEWIRLDHNQVVDFPYLTFEYLEDLTIGTYQLSLAPSYIQDSLLRDEEVFQVDVHAIEPGFTRFRLYSRFRNATIHQLWIAYNVRDDNIRDDNEDDNEIEENLILGYYCTCKSGARTLGTCAHVASVLWFLGFARHQERVRYPSISLLYRIFDAAERPMPNDLNDLPELLH